MTVDTGSFAILIKEGLYKPSATAKPTNLSEFIQFAGANEDGTGPAEVGTTTAFKSNGEPALSNACQETIFYVSDDISFGGVTVHNFLVGNITQGDDLPGDG